jgi:hypothetical protein
MRELSSEKCSLTVLICKNLKILVKPRDLAVSESRNCGRISTSHNKCAIQNYLCCSNEEPYKYLKIIWFV